MAKHLAHSPRGPAALWFVSCANKNQPNERPKQREIELIKHECDLEEIIQEGNCQAQTDLCPVSGPSWQGPPRPPELQTQLEATGWS